MPAHDKKPTDDKKPDAAPFEFKNPFSSAEHDEKDKPADKADADSPAEPTENPAAKAKASKTDEPEVPAAPQRTIAELLADKSFDPEGHVRSKLAAISAKDGGDQCPPAELVDADGHPVKQQGSI